MILTIRRWRADDDDPEFPGMMGGTVQDLTPESEDEGTGLVYPDGTPVPRKLAPRRPIGFRQPGDCGE